jgi:hypothetical protein
MFKQTSLRLKLAEKHTHFFPLLPTGSWGGETWGETGISVAWTHLANYAVCCQYLKPFHMVKHHFADLTSTFQQNSKHLLILKTHSALYCTCHPYW